jgi:hypothetical protein
VKSGPSGTPKDDAKRPIAPLMAAIGGAALSAVVWVVLGIAVIGLGGYRGMDGLVLVALFLGLLQYIAVAGAICGWFALRKRKYSPRRAAWLVPPIAIALVVIPATLIAEGERMFNKKFPELRDLRVAYVNYSSHWIRNIGIEGMSYERDNPRAPILRTLPEGATATATPGISIGRTPDWSSSSSLSISWWRPAATDTAAGSAATAPALMMEARVAIPEYTSQFGKVLVVVFLPHDRVRVQVHTRLFSDNLITQPAEDELVAQGKLARCRYDDGCPWRVTPAD